MNPTNPWLDILVRFGVPTAFLAVVLWKLWPMVVTFIDHERERVKRLEDRAEVLAMRHEEATQNHIRATSAMADKFSGVLQKYNESNAETAKQLARIARQMETISEILKVNQAGGERK